MAQPIKTVALVVASVDEPAPGIKQFVVVNAVALAFRVSTGRRVHQECKRDMAADHPCGLRDRRPWIADRHQAAVH